MLVKHEVSARFAAHLGKCRPGDRATRGKRVPVEAAIELDRPWRRGPLERTLSRVAAPVLTRAGPAA